MTKNNINFYVVKHSKSKIIDIEENIFGYLVCNNWDDYNYKTTFELFIYVEGDRFNIGYVKIASDKFKDSGTTADYICDGFQLLPDDFFSLGMSHQYYENIYKAERDYNINILDALKDIVLNDEKIKKLSSLPGGPFNYSLLRGRKIKTIEEQYKRILTGGKALTDYRFSFIQKETSECSKLEIGFEVIPNSNPPTNVHALIGRNGCGKTTLLRNMAESILDKKDIGDFVFFDEGQDKMNKSQFVNVIYVSFSAFDKFIPSNINEDNILNYIGLKNKDGETLKNEDDLANDFYNSLKEVWSSPNRIDMWNNIIDTLESDNNFKEMELKGIYSKKEKKEEYVKSIFKRMSSGHSIIILILSKLVEKIVEKTLIIIDEPESHLHPPLLSAFMRALSDMLINQNGVAILATHSPVVLQEIPKTCVNIMHRSHRKSKIEKPESETFAENVGILTREVFKLEVENSGFYKILMNEANKGGYDEIISKYNNQIGFEGKATLQAISFEIKSKDNEKD